MPFGFFKKKKKEDELHYDPTNIGVMDIRKGWVFEYDFKTWEVTEEYEYDWGNNHFTYEFKCVSSDDTVFLGLDEAGDEIDCYIMRTLKFSRLPEDVEKSIVNDGAAPRVVTVEGITFYRDSDRAGYSRNIDDEDWDEFIVWDYVDDTGKHALSIEQWGEHEFNAAIGIIVNARDISNILPV